MIFYLHLLRNYLLINGNPNNFLNESFQNYFRKYLNCENNFISITELLLYESDKC